MWGWNWIKSFCCWPLLLVAGFFFNRKRDQRNLSICTFLLGHFCTREEKCDPYVFCVHLYTSHSSLCVWLYCNPCVSELPCACVGVHISCDTSCLVDSSLSNCYFFLAHFLVAIKDFSSFGINILSFCPFIIRKMVYWPFYIYFYERLNNVLLVIAHPQESMIPSVRTLSCRALWERCFLQPLPAP